MQFISSSVLAITALLMISCGSSSATPKEPTNDNTTGALLELPPPIRTVFQLKEKPTWVENIAVGPSGDLFVTLLWPTASLYRIRDPSSHAPKVDIIYTIESAQGLTGITAISRDTYVVAAANYSTIAQPVPGTGALWAITVPKEGNAAARKIADISESALLNGLTTVPATQCHGNATTVLVAESINGVVWRVNTDTSAYDVAVKVPEMAPTSDAILPIGVNGIKIRDHYLYWTNSATTNIYRVPIDADGAAVTGAAVETVAHIDAVLIDDFTFDRAGNLWVTTNPGNKVILVRPDGSSQVVVGGTGELTVAGATAAMFGRGPADKSTLYITTAGANGSPVNGTITEPAKVVAVST